MRLQWQQPPAAVGGNQYDSPAMAAEAGVAPSSCPANARGARRRAEIVAWNHGIAMRIENHHHQASCGRWPSRRVGEMPSASL